MVRMLLGFQMLMILQNRGKYTVRELSQRLETSERNVRKMKYEFELSGIPIQNCMGRNGGYFLDVNKNYKIPALSFNSLECSTLKEIINLVSDEKKKEILMMLYHKMKCNISNF